MFKIPKQEYTAEFKELAVKRVKSGLTIGAVARELGMVEQTLRNWVKAAEKGKLNPPGAKVITPEQMELSRLRVENARLRMECEILKNCPRGMPRPIGVETGDAYTTLRPDSGRPLFGGISPRQKTWPRGSCGPSCGGILRDPV
jgi:transposase